MDIKPQKPAGRTVDGFKAGSKQAGATLDLRSPVESEESPSTKVSTKPQASAVSDRSDDPLQGLIDEPAPVTPAKAPKKGRLRKVFWWTLASILVLLFIGSLALFIYVNYYRAQ